MNENQTTLNKRERVVNKPVKEESEIKAVGIST